MPSLSAHGTMATLALLPLLIWGVYRGIPVMLNADISTDVEIGVEHAGPGHVSITRSIGGNAHIVDIGNTGIEDIAVSIPDSWTRGEVRHVPLATLISDAPIFGYQRWTLPAGALVTFHPARDWGDLTLHNAGESLLKLTMIVVDLDRGTTDMNAYLVQDEPLMLRF